MLDERKSGRTSYADWDKIDAAEIARARPGAPRGKFPSVQEMLAVLGR